jgi:hypothetical protein
MLLRAVGSALAKCRCAEALESGANEYRHKILVLLPFGVLKSSVKVALWFEPKIPSQSITLKHCRAM